MDGWREKESFPSNLWVEREKYLGSDQRNSKIFHF